ncbi:hypothetical protein P170DRAFT_475422 [Aspergillus steynii IBT 23096]|uniref:BTB domain-containing protein n=1 Tax=Aspergillus steynii IBT 23096 TaxID=1392250 RepID=A0A2I2G8B4_9EURO|nr:uncharacterized protein P170DRAFT_475422 [Aspergillus steynii IBT 23096]PLB49105.1 hypothetical protein P170DRAFT_475422 [Aspergillus steynii IBT 23096]
MSPPAIWKKSMQDLLSSGEFSDCKESHEQTVDLPEDDVNTVKRVITFMYTHDYDEEGPEDEYTDDDNHSTSDQSTEGTSDRPQDDANTENEHNAVVYIHLIVYRAADKFGIEDLKSLVAEKLVSWTETGWCSNTFFKTAQDIMGVTPLHKERLSKLVTDTITKHFSHFIKFNNLKLKQLLADNEAIGSAALIKMIDQQRIIGTREEWIQCLEKALRWILSKNHRNGTYYL